jgi:IS5 family transposase
LILDLVIEAGNPADSERLLPMLERHIAAYGAAPRQAAADGGFASRDNLSWCAPRFAETLCRRT